MAQKILQKPQVTFIFLRYCSVFENSLNLKHSFVSGLKTNWINVRHWLFFGSKNLFKSFRFLNLSYFSVLRYRVVVPSFIGSAKEEKPLPPYLLEYFFPYSATLDFNIFSPLKLSINSCIHLLQWDLFWIYPNRHLLV